MIIKSMISNHSQWIIQLMIIKSMISNHSQWIIQLASKEAKTARCAAHTDLLPS